MLEIVWVLQGLVTLCFFHWTETWPKMLIWIGFLIVGLTPKRGFCLLDKCIKKICNIVNTCKIWICIYPLFCHCLMFIYCLSVFVCIWICTICVGCNKQILCKITFNVKEEFIYCTRFSLWICVVRSWTKKKEKNKLKGQGLKGLFWPFF